MSPQDMNEVGNFKGDEPQRSDEEQSHWGLWSVVSAPLVLGCNLNDSAVVDRIWPTITNQDAERVNRAWAGRPGTLIRSYPADPSECSGSTASGSCIRVGQSACDGSTATVGWVLNDQHQLQAPIKGAAGEALCLTTSSDGAQAWPFTSPVPTSQGKYNGVLVEVGVGNLLADCSSPQAKGNWSFNSTNKALQLSSGNSVKCLSAKPADFNTGAFFGGAKPSVTQVDQCPGAQPANTTQIQLSSKGELKVGDGSVCISAVPLYGLQLWSKPLGNGSVATLILNLLEANQTGSVPLADVPGVGVDYKHALDIWATKTSELTKPQLDVSLRPHQSAFFILSNKEIEPSATFYA